jgi:hypothetical protein
VLTVHMEVGAAAFLREPLDLLFNTMMPLDNLLRRSPLEEVHEQLVEARNHARRKEILEQLMLRTGASACYRNDVLGLVAKASSRRMK